MSFLSILWEVGKYMVSYFLWIFDIMQHDQDKE